jgi:hypothetical protein
MEPLENLESLTREQLEQYYVNLYRRSWGSNAGLSSDKIKNMPTKYLKTCIRSQHGFIETIEKARGSQQ